MAYFFFSFSSFFLTRFCSSSRCSPKFPPLQAAGTNFEKIGEKAWNFSSFLVQEPDLEPRNLSPLLEKPDLPCSASSPPAALALWGRIGLVFLLAAGLLPPAMSGFCSCKLWYLVFWPICGSGVTVHVGVTVHRLLFTGYCSHPEGQHLTGI
ncbi:hypothetical protein SLEP1_g27686 [Rubroshorea leprosula]|uniref:Uncharacterized protein n=1 Tax=Rubroshorea leprosula TaxID=152421 RepID=A0AAV5JRC3_9ROSI|nr:hypothetical protein SLEP1_g27686 [Rubroshorea leprosula]